MSIFIPVGMLIYLAGWSFTKDSVLNNKAVMVLEDPSKPALQMQYFA